MKTEAAQAAKMVRAALKVAFPGMKFTVRSSTYSGGDSVRVEWTNGPDVESVQKIAEQFEGGTFDGMTDMYTYDHSKTGPTAKFVFCSRSIDSALSAKVVSDLRSMFVPNASRDFETMSYRILRRADLRNGYAGLRSVDGFPGFDVIPQAS